MTQEKSKNKWSANVEKSDADTGQSLGSYFQRERQKKQLTIQEVAKATRIPPETLQAIEAGNKKLLPVPVFTRGFVKIYAAHLNLNKAEILERFSNEWGTVTSTTPAILSGESMAESSPFFLSFRFYFSLFLIALLVSLAYFFFQADDMPPPAALTTIPLTTKKPAEQVVVKNEAVKQLKIIPTAPSRETLLISPQSAGKISLEEDESPENTSLSEKRTEYVDDRPRQTFTSSQEKVDTDDDGQLTTSPESSQLSPLATAIESPAPEVRQQKRPFFQSVNLHIRFVKKTRISVAQDDDQPEKFIFAPGEESSWQAASHITLHIDNADGVVMTLNGSPIIVDDHKGPLAITLPTDLDR